MRSEIFCPQTEPETEWVGSRALQKASPAYRHGLAQSRVASALISWADATNGGRVATEWRFRLAPPGEPRRPLVPDVAYVAYAVLSADAGVDEVDVPTCAPTVAVEILSPDDRTDDVHDKIATYLAAGSSVVLIVDPVRHTGAVHDVEGIRALGVGDVFQHAALPGFAVSIDSLFGR